ncbi:MAG: SdpI family protein [Candidatus Paceibacterota bacterium]|jgi:uncharacterized membrane protein
MSPRFVGTLLLIIILACIATGVIVYPNLSATLISHWDAAGRANGTMGKFWGTFLLPLMMLAFSGLWSFLPRIDPIAPGFKSFRYVYDFFFFLLIAFLAYVYALSLGANLGWQFNMLTMTLPALALFILILGALMPYMKRNWFIGIRTPWTISDDIVWDKTHRLGGTLFEVAALFIFAGIFVSPKVATWFILIPIIAATLISIIYSYVIFARIKRTN